MCPHLWKGLYMEEHRTLINIRSSLCERCSKFKINSFKLLRINAHKPLKQEAHRSFLLLWDHWRRYNEYFSSYSITLQISILSARLFFMSQYKGCSHCCELHRSDGSSTRQHFFLHSFESMKKFLEMLQTANFSLKESVSSVLIKQKSNQSCFYFSLLIMLNIHH